MKRTTIFLLFTALLLSPLYPLSTKLESSKPVAAPKYLDIPTKNPFVGSVTTFQHGSNGYGWYLGANNKIDFDPVTETFGSVYRQHHSAGSGTAGISWGYFGDDGFDDEAVVHLPNDNYAGTRYPFTVSGYGYHFNVSTEYALAGTDQSRIYLTTINDDGDYIEVKVVAPNGATLSGWLTQADITFNEATGEYIMGISAENDLNSDPYHCSVVIGKTTNPMDPDGWIFSDWNDISFIGEENNPNPGTGAFYRGYNTPKIQWGRDGFGILFTFVSNEIEPEAQEIMPAYAYTTDYGETWVTDNGKFFSDLEAYQTGFDWWGTEVNIGGNILPINKTAPWASTKCIVDQNNIIHFIHPLRAGASEDGESYYRVWITDDDQPVSGLYHTALTIDTTTGEGVYDHNYIATFGGVGSEAFGEYDLQYYYIDEWTLSIGISADNIIYTGWLDRPILDENTSISPWLGQHPNSPRFIGDPYFSYSLDFGEHWNVTQLSEQFEGLSFGHNLLNTQEIHEEGFDLMKKTKSTDDTYPNLELYGVWQEADLSATPTTPPTIWREAIQEYKVTKINSNLSDINELTPSSISLKQNYPNPFNPTTTINFTVEMSSNVELTVYNSAGEEVTKLINGIVNCGNHSIKFDGSNLDSGVYFYNLSVNSISETRKMVLCK